MIKKSFLLLFLLLSACSTYKPPPTADKSNIRPINTEESIQLINEKVSPNATKR